MMACKGMGAINPAKRPTALNKGGTVKDACYKKVKRQYKVFPFRVCVRCYC